VVIDLATVVIDFLRSLHVPDVPIGQFWLPDIVSWVGLGTLQAIVLVSIIQLAFAWVDAHKAWRPSDWRRGLFQFIEWAIVFALGVSLVPLVVTPDHGSLLGSGFDGWWPGIVLTIGTLAFAWVASTVPKAWPATTLFFASIAVVLFAFAMASAVFAIFERPGLEVGELGYAVIWAAFILLYKLGQGRWSVWDRIERRVAYRASPEETVRRRSVWLSMFGFVFAGAGLVLWVLDPPFAPFEVASWVWALGAGGVLIAAAVALGALVDWTGAENPINSPGAVQSARGRV
jgi:hypothetical protein